MSKRVGTMSPERLARYAEWYVSRYSPSKSRLLAKLVERAAERADAIEIFERMAPFIDDRIAIRTALGFRLTYGKSLRSLRPKLRLKGFLKEDIDAVFQEFESDVTDWDSRLPGVVSKMKKCVHSGRSKTEALFALWNDFPEFRDQVAELVKSQYPSDAEMLEKLEKCRPGTFASTNLKTLSARLGRKGFSYDSIRKFLEGKGEFLREDE